MSTCTTHTGHTLTHVKTCIHTNCSFTLNVGSCSHLLSVKLDVLTKCFILSLSNGFMFESPNYDASLPDPATMTTAKESLALNGQFLPAFKTTYNRIKNSSSKSKKTETPASSAMLVYGNRNGLSLLRHYTIRHRDTISTAHVRQGETCVLHPCGPVASERY